MRFLALLVVAGGTTLAAASQQLEKRVPTTFQTLVRREDSTSVSLEPVDLVTQILIHPITSEPLETSLADPADLLEPADFITKTMIHPITTEAPIILATHSDLLEPADFFTKTMIHPVTTEVPVALPRGDEDEYDEYRDFISRELHNDWIHLETTEALVNPLATISDLLEPVDFITKTMIHPITTEALVTLAAISDLDPADFITKTMVHPITTEAPVVLPRQEVTEPFLSTYTRAEQTWINPITTSIEVFDPWQGPPVVDANEDLPSFVLPTKCTATSCRQTRTRRSTTTTSQTGEPTLITKLPFTEPTLVTKVLHN
ncbi:hypothetical protein B0J11DRAFT_544099 [Dendryphion nanum]|uniref:Uncharacterized protein n=1 Tax=Dendryphion nanum TaxID=256645 RepID=A0A9P9D1E9_9PLEO|nr:hypothetical protein B0J11DRAFT_544099 [Dendryphion nanum]